MGSFLSMLKGDQSSNRKMDSGASFPVTEWSMVISAVQAGEAGAEAALMGLCEAYLHPVYAYYRAVLGLATHDAEDLTVEFLARMKALACSSVALREGSLKHAAPHSETPQPRIRFRDFLRSCAKRLALKKLAWDQAQKRGGTVPHLSFDELAEVINETVADTDLFERATLVYDREWSIELVRKARAQLKSEYMAAGAEQEEQSFFPCLFVEMPQEPRERAAKILGISPDACKKRLERYRVSFRKHLRRSVSDTLSDPNDLNDELRYLIKVFSASPSFE